MDGEEEQPWWIARVKITNQSINDGIDLLTSKPFSMDMAITYVTNCLFGIVHLTDNVAVPWSLQAQHS